MLTAIHPKLPMRSKVITKAFYVQKLGFEVFGGDYEGYLMLQKDGIQIHFFEYKDLNPFENYGQIYLRTDNIQFWYDLAQKKEIRIPKLGQLQIKPWLQREFSILDPDHNLITFGQEIKM